MVVVMVVAVVVLVLVMVMVMVIMTTTTTTMATVTKERMVILPLVVDVHVFETTIINPYRTNVENRVSS